MLAVNLWNSLTSDCLQPIQIRPASHGGLALHCCCSPDQDGRPIISSIAISKHRVLKNERRPSALTMVVRQPSDHHQAPYHDAVPIPLSSSEMSLVHRAGDSLVPAWLTLDSPRSSILSYLCRFRRQPSLPCHASPSPPAVQRTAAPDSIVESTTPTTRVLDSSESILSVAEGEFSSTGDLQDANERWIM